MSPRLVWLSTLLVFVSGCFGTDTGNPPVTATLTSRSGVPTVAVAPGTADVVVTEGWVSIRDVRYVLGSACDHTSESVAMDLAGDVVAGVGTTFPEEVVCGLHVSPGPIATLPTGAPDALRDRTLLVRGTRADGTPFEIASDSVVGIDVVSGTDDVTLTMDGDVLVAFDVARWLAGVDLDAIPVAADGVARLLPGEPGADAVALDGSIELYRDADGDGRIGAAEEAAGPIATSHAP